MQFVPAMMQKIFRDCGTAVTLLLALLCVAASKPTKHQRVERATAVSGEETAAAPAPFPTPSAGEHEPNGAPKTRAAAVLVQDVRSGAVLFEKNADAPRAAASTQKLLTALLVAESGYLDQSVTVQPTDTFAEPVNSGSRPGEVYERIDLLRALLVKSPNDVARCLARDNAGSIEAFAARDECQGPRARRNPFAFCESQRAPDAGSIFNRT